MDDNSILSLFVSLQIVSNTKHKFQLLGIFSCCFLCPLNMPHPFWNTSLLSGTTDFSGLFYLFFASFLESNTSPVSPGFFNWRMIFRNHYLGIRCVLCYWAVIASRPLQQREVRNYVYIKYVYTNPYIHTHLCVFFSLSHNRWIDRCDIMMYVYIYMYIYIKPWDLTNTVNYNSTS